MGRLATTFAIVGIAAATGCGHGPRHVTDVDPADKIPAIETAVRHHDRRIIPQLVNDLDNPDPAIRLYVIRGLRNLTRQDLGYKYFEDDDARKPAIERWRQWLASQPKF